MGRLLCSGGVPPTISLPMQRKLITVVTCQLMDEEGRIKVVRAARSLGERAVTELLLLHQNPQQLAPNLWTAVRTRGCQFLGPGKFESLNLQTIAHLHSDYFVSL